MEGAGMFFAVSPLRAWHPWTCWSNKNQENFIFWQSACDAEVGAHISKSWDPTRFSEFLWILPHRERVEPNPLIAVPQKVAPITSVGEEQRLSCMAGEVAVVPPGEETTALSLRVNYAGTLPALGFPLRGYLSNILHPGSPETKLWAKTSIKRNHWMRLKAKGGICLIPECYGLSCIPNTLMLKCWALVPQNASLFGDRVFSKS